MSRRTQDPSRRAADFDYRIVTFSDGPFQVASSIRAFVTPMRRPTTPEGKPSGLGCFRFARRYSGNRDCFLFLRVMRCFSSPGMPFTSYVFRSKYHPITDGGFPHSEISGSKRTYCSPKHIGVRPVLHRLLVPRHPPCALSSLTLDFARNSVLTSSVHIVRCD